MSSFPLSNPRSSSPAGPSNIHHGDKNEHNNGIIGPGSKNFVANNNKDCQFHTYAAPEDGNELDNLLYPDISKDARHDSLFAPIECHPDTRKTPCNSIKAWMSDPKESPLLWLHGPAGVGKSTIAKTISIIPPNQFQIVATFFFSATSDKRGDALFLTLAWQLAKNFPETEKHIVDALKRDRLLTKSKLKQQFDQLIVQPLKKCTSRTTPALVMIIDGVDECSDENMQTEFLNILKGAGKEGCWPLRFLICSRPDPRIREIMETTDDDYATAKSTHSSSSDISQSSPTVDPAVPVNTGQSGIPIIYASEQQSPSLPYRVWIKIEPYLSRVKVRLNSLRRWRPRRPTVLPSDAWMLFQPMQLGVVKGSSPEMRDELDKIYPRKVISRIQIGLSEESKKDVIKYLTDEFMKIGSSGPITSEAIEELVERSCGQFLYASIIVKLLDSSGFSSSEVLEMARSSSLPSPDLDQLYSAILVKAGGGHRSYADTELRDAFAILVVLWENVQLANIPESFPIIGCLLVLENDKLKRILRRMHSILDIIPGKSIRVYHRSFFEFLQHRRRSGDHCIAYPFALRRFLFLLSWFVLRYAVRRYCNQVQDDDKKQAERIRDMVITFPRNFFRRSTNPTKLATFHAWVHTSVICLLWAFFFWLRLDFWDRSIVSLGPSLCVFFVRCFLIILLFTVVGPSILLLICCLSYSIIKYPLFHPFLHPFLVSTSDFFLQMTA